MTQPAKNAQPVTSKSVTLTALYNNITVRFGHLNIDVEQAFQDWLHTEGFQEFLEWLKAK